MPRFYSPQIAFKTFIQDVQLNRPGFFTELSELSNGFENWLKIEFYLWLKRTYRLEGQTSIGMECSLKTSKKHPNMKTKVDKRVDLWVEDRSGDNYHYIELKVPFSNDNRGKMFDSAARDLWFMCHLRPNYTWPTTGSVIVMGVGFDEMQWKLGMQKVIHPHLERVKTSGLNRIETEGRSVYWECVTYTYSSK